MHKPIGALYHENTKSCRFSLWAPDASTVKLKLLSPQEKELDMIKNDWGYWQLEVDQLPPGATYKYQLDNKDPLPDPASRFQSEGPHGPSTVVPPSFPWTDEQWKGIPRKELIIYELHVGTFSKAGTFAGIAEKLDYLQDLGINAIEIMPVAQFPGNRNWGYDGASLFATQNSYGGPEAFKKLIDQCHAKGIAVILDVVYNHLGPEGNYLSEYGPYFTDKYHTPWGQALNFDDAYCDGVRNFFLQNALMWLRDFHIDGLRLDAVHAIKDLSAKHFLTELSEVSDGLSKEDGHQRILIAEVDLNDNRYISDREKGGYGLQAQWIDEFHHALHAWLTGETNGYYEDFGKFEHLVRAYRDTYVYNGVYSPHRKKIFGSSAENNPTDQFVVFAQNHDQTGNRMLGDRLSLLVPYEALKLSAAAYILSPYLPMLFMGEEWGEKNPFFYFVSHTDPELVEAVRKGRKKEFAAFHGDEAPPDPQSEETFKRAKLNWNFPEQAEQEAMREFYKELIRIRKISQAYKISSRESFRLMSWDAQNCIGLLKTGASPAVLTILNFGRKTASLVLDEIPQGSYSLLLNSANEKWQGPGKRVLESLTPGNSLEIPALTATVYELKD